MQLAQLEAPLCNEAWGGNCMLIRDDWLDPAHGAAARKSLSRRRMISGLAALGASVPSASVLRPNLARAALSGKSYFFDFANILESGAEFKDFGDRLMDAAKIAGIRIKRYNNNNDGTTTINNARLMVQDRPDLILEYTAVEGMGPSLQRLFSRAKIPYIAINIPIPGGYWFNLVNKQIGTETAKVVVAAAQEKGWTAADTTVLIVQGSQYGSEVNDCVRYFYVTAAANMPGMDQVEPSAITSLTTAIGKSGIQVDGKATLEGSYSAVKNALQALPSDRHILLYAINDDSAIGAWRAVAESQREKNTLVAGLAGSAAAIHELRTNPQWIAQGSIFFSNWGEYLIAMGVAIMNGVKPPPLTKCPQLILTKSTVDKYYDASGRVKLLPPLVPENLYLKDTGILQKFRNIEGL
jgi:ribose transport system substrate-binding protein